MGEWMVRPKTLGERTRYEVYKILHDTGDVIIRGGLWDTEKEADTLAKNLNRQEERKHK
jgi:hypothetical protein